MSELINLFAKLSEFCDSGLLWEQVEEIYEEEQNAGKNDDSKKPKLNEAPTSASDSNVNKIKCVQSLPMVQRAINDSQVLATLLELCSAIRDLRGESSNSYDNTYDSWDQVVKSCPRDSYLAFVYALTCLASLDCTNANYTKLSMAAVNTYFLSLTIPGAKGFHIFEEDVISHGLQVFTLLERIQNQDILSRMSRQQPVDIWVRFATFCDDLKLVLRYVHFIDHKNTRDGLLKKLVEIQYLNHDRGYANHYAANLHAKCFEIFEEVINAHNGEPEETLMKLMNLTIFLHTCPPRPKNSTSSGGSGEQCEHISDWFIKCIGKYPRLLVKILSFYIECIITNPIKTWKTEQTQRALDYAAKYDAALFTKCNESCVEFLCDAIRAEEVMIRSRAIDLMARILQMESHVDWQMFTHEVSSIPREVHLIKELIESLQDNNNSIKLKAVQGLQSALTRGSPNAKKILTECLRFTRFSDVDVVLPDEPRVCKNEIRYEKPKIIEAQYTFTGHELLSLVFLHLPDYIYAHFYQNRLSYIRRAGIMFAEQMVHLNPLIIYNTNFVEETTQLVNEPTALVRKQTLVSVDALLSSYPNCYHIIWVWCKIIAPMLHDGDVKNVELAMECFRNRVLLNMKSIEQTNQAEHFMPWVIIRTLLTTQSRLYLQTCFHLALQQRMVTTQILSIIESHLLTTNSTEAWVMLNFVSGKVKTKEPDALIHQFLSLQSWNKETNMSIALEVLANCIRDFSHTALNHAFTHILTSIRKGEMLPALIAKAFDFLILIDNRSRSSNNCIASNHELEHWIAELHAFLENCVLTGINDFPDNRCTFMSQLYAYSEVNLHTLLRPHNTIISFVHKYISECIKLPESELNLENEQLFNLMTLLAGRFSLRDACVATTTCTLYSVILRTIDRPPIVNTIIVALMDMCKKHTQIVERIIERVLRKLTSPYEVNRIETFKCFEKLVLQDQLKLRGSLLVMLLAAILDDSQEVAQRASNFFVEFLSKKNATLFQKCLIECPFVFNEYKNYEGFDSFSETTIQSPLLGEGKRKSRQMLYNHMMAEMEEINLILYFGQLKLIAEKSQHDPLIKSTEGVALIKDILFILRRICQLTKEQKSKNNDNKDDSENKGDAAEVADILAGAEEKTGTDSAPQTTAVSAGGGRNRRRREITMPEAMTQLEKSLIFISTIYEHIHEYDTSIEKSFDDLGRALAKRFPNLIEYAQPAKFWNKYRAAKMSNSEVQARKGTKRKHKSQPDETECTETNETDEITERPPSVADETADESDASSDDDLPILHLRSPRIAGSTIGANSTEALPMKYLFQPNI